MSLRLSYTFLAPFYDLFAGPAFTAARRASLAALPRAGSAAVLVNGVGSGLDLPWLPRGHRYVGLDLTCAMLARARKRAADAVFAPVQGNGWSARDGQVRPGSSVPSSRRSGGLRRGQVHHTMNRSSASATPASSSSRRNPSMRVTGPILRSTDAL